MRGAWGKPYGTVARVNIGQIILSIRCKDQNAAVVQEALRRARYKFPGRQKIIVSRKWGFTNVNREEYLKLKEDKRVIQCVVFNHYAFRHGADVSFSGTELTYSTSATAVLSRTTSVPSSRHEGRLQLLLYFMPLAYDTGLGSACTLLV